MKKNEKIDILYEDKYIIIVNKPPHMLSISTDKHEQNTLYKQISEYVKKQHKSNKIFIVHRLDKDTSGIMIFAKSEKIKKILQNNWEKVERKYVALVEGEVKDSNTIQTYLKETKDHYVYSSKDGKLAITEYNSIWNNKNYSLLNINILTGRKNQIRVHMKDINHPIVGDKKYGSNKNLFRRLCLHATSLRFKHPITNKMITITSPYPKMFDNVK